MNFKKNNVINWFSFNIKDPIGTVKRLADFLKVPYTDDFVNEVVEKCSFDNLKENKIDASRCIHPEGKSTLYRKGQEMQNNKIKLNK